MNYFYAKLPQNFDQRTFPTQNLKKKNQVLVR